MSAVDAQAQALNLCMAPLRGVTVSIYREVYAHYFTGLDRAVSPFVTTVRGRKVKAAVLREVDPAYNKGLPLIPQLLSKDPDEMRVMIRTLRDLGYSQINLNLGCPHPMVRNRGRGSGLMADESALRHVLDASCDEMPTARPSRTTEWSSAMTRRSVTQCPPREEGEEEGGRIPLTLGEWN